jgi:hypothetical protein
MSIPNFHQKISENSYYRKWFQMAAWICSHKFCDNYNNRDAWELLFLAAFIPAFCNLSGKWCSSDRYVWCDDQQVSMFPGAISTKELEDNFEEYKDKNLIAYWYHAHSLDKPIDSFTNSFPEGFQLESTTLACWRLHNNHTCLFIILLSSLHNLMC